MTSLQMCSVLTEMQKTEYMVFAGRQYFLGDKCQVPLLRIHPSTRSHLIKPVGPVATRLDQLGRVGGGGATALVSRQDQHPLLMAGVALLPC